MGFVSATGVVIQVTAGSTNTPEPFLTKLLTQVLTRGLDTRFLPRRQKTPCFQRVSMERMKGLEPSTFCMASTREPFP
jgi:hypothetical protein